MPPEEYQNIEILLELDQGKSIAEIAKSFGVRAAYVRKLSVESGLSPAKKTKKTKKAQGQELAMVQIQEGESLEDVAQQFQITVPTLKQWCIKNGVDIPREYEQLTAQERKEIRELLDNDEDTEEIRCAYKISNKALEELSEPSYKKLDAASLGFLFEVLREDQNATPARIRKLAQELGMDISKEAIRSYQDRLKSMGM